jgi:uncharacterized integral membrane protein (TIGR00698 family)
MNNARGIVAALLLGLAAYWTNHQLDTMGWFRPGSSTLAFVFGVVFAQVAQGLQSGGRWMTKKLMPYAIILLGFGLNLTQFLQPEVGLRGITVALTSATTCLVISYLLGRRLGLDRASAIAIGAGGAICGNSAVIAVSGPLKLSEERIAVALSVVNLMGFVTFFSIPILAASLGLPEIDAGVWAGSVVHAVPQAVAAGEAIGEQAGVVATAVKLTRVTLLVVLVPLCAYLSRDEAATGSETGRGWSIPFFVPGFIIAACLATWVMPAAMADILLKLAKLMLIPILAAVGFFINRSSIQEAAGPILVVGVVSTLFMTLLSYGLLISI